jgi:hypothetical protein
MRRLLIATALLALATPASAAHLHLYHTYVPPHWLLDRGPRIIEVPPYEPSTSTAPSPSLAVPFHAKTNEEAAAEARAQSARCEPVRLTTDEGTVLHRPSQCNGRR